MEQYADLITEAFAANIAPCKDPTRPEEWARFGFHVGFQLYKKVRPWRYRVDDILESLKADGSPSTAVELEMEEWAREALARFCPEAAFYGEELGGAAEGEPYLFLIDPIDGTWSFLSGFETYSITLAILQDGTSLFSLVCAPASGEMYFRIGKGPSMVLQIPEGGGRLELHRIPLLVHTEDKPILVNLHPSKRALPYLERLFDLWRQGEIALLKSVSGSPSLLMAEAARTGTYYINTWEDDRAAPYDLIPALHLIDASHCRAVRRDGRAVDAWDHRGFFMVGPGGEKFDQLLQKMPDLR